MNVDNTLIEGDDTRRIPSHPRIDAVMGPYRPGRFLNIYFNTWNSDRIDFHVNNNLTGPPSWIPVKIIYTLRV